MQFQQIQAFRDAWVKNFQNIVNASLQQGLSQLTKLAAVDLSMKVAQVESPNTQTTSQPIQEPSRKELSPIVIVKSEISEQFRNPGKRVRDVVSEVKNVHEEQGEESKEQYMTEV